MNQKDAAKGANIATNGYHSGQHEKGLGNQEACALKMLNLCSESDNDGYMHEAMAYARCHRHGTLDLRSTSTPARSQPSRSTSETLGSNEDKLTCNGEFETHH